MSEPTWITTYSGKRFYPFGPRPEDVDLKDIAHSLAQQCRFTGHCRDYYSVAQHSVELSAHLQGSHGIRDPGLLLCGLLHDAAEAYLSDVVRPLKPHTLFHIWHPTADCSIHPFAVVEQWVLRAVLGRFRLNCLSWPLVNLADLRMLATERRDLFDPGGEPWECLRDIEPYRSPIVPLPPAEAEAAFLERFHVLQAQRAEHE